MLNFHYNNSVWNRKNNTKNPFLNAVIQFLNSNDPPDEKLFEILNESHSKQLVPAAIFLCYWIPNRYKYDQQIHGESSESHYQHVLYILDLIMQRVPPVILLSGFLNIDLNYFRSFQFNSKTAQVILNRCQFMKSLLRPFPYDIHFLRSDRLYEPLENLDNYIWSVFSADEIDFNYYSLFYDYFLFLLTNHVPAKSFEPLFHLSHSEDLILYSIFRFFKKLNSSRKLSHAQLLFLFTNLFKYIDYFVNHGYINGLTFVTTLQSQPYLSPFCILGMINSIPEDSYLYKLLIPPELTKNPFISNEVAQEIILKVYPIYSYSDDTTFDELIKLIPNYLVRYFLIFESPVKTSINISSQSSDLDLIIYFHQSENKPLQKISTLFQISQTKPISPLVICSLSCKIIRIVIFTLLSSFQRAYSQFLSQKSLRIVFASIIAWGLPNLNPTTFLKFISSCIEDIEIAGVAFRSIYLYLLPALAKYDLRKYLIPLILNVTNFNNIIPHTQKNIKNYEIALKSAHILLTGLLRSQICQLSKEIDSLVINSSDIFVILEYIDLIETFQNYGNYSEQKQAISFRQKLLEQMGVSSLQLFSSSNSLDSLDPSDLPIKKLDKFFFQSPHENPNCFKNFKFTPNIISNDTLVFIYFLLLHPNPSLFLQTVNHINNNMNINNNVNSNMNINNNINNNEVPISIQNLDLNNVMSANWIAKVKPIPAHYYIRLLCSFHDLQKEDLAKAVCLDLISELHSNETFFSDFIINNSTYAFQTAQCFLISLIQNDHISLAEQLQTEMIPFLIESNDFSIYWLTSYIKNFSSKFTLRMKNELIFVIESHQETRNYIPKGPNYILSGCEIIRESYQKIDQEPDIVFNSTASPFFASLFSISSIILLKLTKEQIIQDLLIPFIDFQTFFLKREEVCRAYGKLISFLPPDFILDFFEQLISYPLSNMIINCVNFILIYIPLSAFSLICCSAKKMINNDNTKLFSFLKMFLPCMSRLKGSEYIATTLICGLLESVTNKTPKQLQESVIDAMGIAYVAFKLHKSRTAFIRASNNFLPELKIIIASSLEIEVEKGK